MGATDFSIVYVGRRIPEDAFRKLIRKAQFESGHSSYTGTIAEKDLFKMILLPPRKNAETFINHILNEECNSNDETKIANKWGPAGCIELKGSQRKHAIEQHGPHWKGKRGVRVYIFFGIASC